MRAEYAELSLRGGRDSNQDRVAVAVADEAALLIVCDGMGGHADGERAAEVGLQTVVERFWRTPQPLLDPLGFLHLSLGASHENVVALGVQLPMELRPRATSAVCLLQGSSCYWAHVGDSRIYQLRAGRVLERTRDHSHVELLVREGLISAGQMQNHPMRNFVESCLGGEPILPEMAIGPRHVVQAGDVMLVCSDGFWANLDDGLIGSSFLDPNRPLRDTLTELASLAVLNAGAGSDNTSVGALRLLQ